MKIACAMSGGVDSSVAAYLLKKEGHDVVGVTMRLWECFKTPSRKTCCSALDTIDARKVCEQLEMKHIVVDMREAFKKSVIEYFAQEYSVGRTPNPCIKCNEILKFKLLREEVARSLGCDYLATGHYARINPPQPPFEKGGEGGIYKLLKGLDNKKDQSYFLFTLTQEEMAKTLFPLGNMRKEEVRQIAMEAGLKTAEKTESQEICFIPDNDYARFILDYYPKMAKPAGHFVDKHGEIIGRHEGSHAYTIGQRRGLRFGFGKRQYVLKIDVERNEVVLGDDEELFKKEMVVANCKMSDDVKKANPFKGQVKIRYRHEGALAAIYPADGNCARVVFAEPQRAITPGQAAVFYSGDEVVGGGWIK